MTQGLVVVKASSRWWWLIVAASGCFSGDVKGMVLVLKSLGCSRAQGGASHAAWMVGGAW